MSLRNERVHEGPQGHWSSTQAYVLAVILKCTDECDHCFLHCGPSREATFTLGQLKTLVRQIEQLGTVTTVYFEGGEPFLCYSLLLEPVGSMDLSDNALLAPVDREGHFTITLVDPA